MKVIVVVGALLAATLVEGKLDPTIQFPDYTGSSGRIIDGELAAPNQFPHMVHLRITVIGGIRRCGGSLISARHILSTAHCYISSTIIAAQLGSNDFNNPGLFVSTSKYYIHPNFQNSTLNHDLGIAELETEITFTDSIKPILLPRMSQKSDLFIDRVATVSGWGYTTNDGPVSDLLRFVNLTVISKARCTQDFNILVVLNETICCVGADSPQQSTCRGDSGGPLIMFDETENDYIQIGVASFVSGAGCNSGRASGYVRPHHYWSFITRYTGIPTRE